MKKARVKHRGLIQLVVACLSNSFVTGFATGGISEGAAKKLCHPGLNCYSCPGAQLSCPIGSLQAVVGSRSFDISLYVFGLVLAFGALLGRTVCGFLCPFGWLQDLLYKIPGKKLPKTFRGDRQLRLAKYLVLIILVLLLPMVVTNEAGVGAPAFCKWLCPAGTLEAGVPLLTIPRANLPAPTASAPVMGLPAVGLGDLSGVMGSAPMVAASTAYPVGLLFAWKLGLAIAVIILAVVMYRPFCRYLCPLGAIYGLINPISLHRLRFAEAACIHCGRCAKACPMALDPVKELNHAECVRCGDCINACPVDALSMGFGRGRVASPDRTVQPQEGGKE